MTPTDSPSRDIPSLFARLVLAWGTRAFLGQWEGVKTADLHAEWARTLSHVDDAAIEWALDRLPPQPMNAIQFRALCRQAPDKPGAPALPAPPRAIPEQVALELQKLHEPVDGRPEAHRVAARVVARLKGKGKLTPAETTNLEHFTKVLRRYEGGPDFEAERKRAAAMTAERLAQDQHPGEQS